MWSQEIPTKRLAKKNHTVAFSESSFRKHCKCTEQPQNDLGLQGHKVPDIYVFTNSSKSQISVPFTLRRAVFWIIAIFDFGIDYNNLVFNNVGE